MVPGLCVHPLGGQPLRDGQADPQRGGGVAAHGALARGGLELCPLGGLLRGSASGGAVCLAAGAGSGAGVGAAPVCHAAGDPGLGALPLRESDGAGGLSHRHVYAGAGNPRTEHLPSEAVRLLPSGGAPRLPAGESLGGGRPSPPEPRGPALLGSGGSGAGTAGAVLFAADQLHL